MCAGELESVNQPHSVASESTVLTSHDHGHDHENLSCVVTVMVTVADNLNLLRHSSHKPRFQNSPALPQPQFGVTPRSRSRVIY